MEKGKPFGGSSMKSVGILLSLLVSAVVVYITLQSYRSQSGDTSPASLARPLEKAHEVQSVVDLAAVQTALSSFQAQNGAPPKTLDELVAAGLVSREQIQKLDYDPGTGRIFKKQ